MNNLSDPSNTPLAPIWSMRPMLGPFHDVLPLRLLAPGSSEPWDVNDIHRANNRYHAAEPLGESGIPGGLWFMNTGKTLEDADLQVLLERHEIFRLNSMLFVSGGLAGLLAELDLGRGGLHRVPVYMQDGTTEFRRDVFLLEFPNAKDTVNRDATPRCKPLYPNRPDTTYKLPMSLAGRDVFVKSDAVGPPDLWFDPMIDQTQFASDAAAQRLIAEGHDVSFDLNQCKLLDP